jgi:hypothetical protein
MTRRFFRIVSPCVSVFAVRAAFSGALDALTDSDGWRQSVDRSAQACLTQLRDERGK